MGGALLFFRHLTIYTAEGFPLDSSLCVHIQGDSYLGQGLCGMVISFLTPLFPEMSTNTLLAIGNPHSMLAVKSP